MNFWKLVTGSVGMNVKAVWISSEKCQCQCKQWWTDTPCNYGGRGNHVEELEVDWILTEEGKIPEALHLFCKKAKGRVLYVIRQKNPLPSKGRKGKLVRVLHGKAGGEMDRARNLLVMHREM